MPGPQFKTPFWVSELLYRCLDLTGPILGRLTMPLRCPPCDLLSPMPSSWRPWHQDLSSWHGCFRAMKSPSFMSWWIIFMSLSTIATIAITEENRMVSKTTRSTAARLLAPASAWDNALICRSSTLTRRREANWPWTYLRGPSKDQSLSHSSFLGAEPHCTIQLKLITCLSTN